jgi:hypothetical protein
VISLPFAHVGGIPIEETLGTFGPALLAGLAVTWTKLRAHLRTVRSRASAHASRTGGGRAVRAARWRALGGRSAGVRGRSGG